MTVCTAGGITRSRRFKNRVCKCEIYIPATICGTGCRSEAPKLLCMILSTRKCLPCTTGNLGCH